MDIISKIKRGLRYIIKGVPTYYTTANVILLEPSNKLRGNNIIVTGGGRGLGYAMAKKFVQEGANVLIAGRNIEKLEKSAEELQCKALFLDVQDVNSFSSFLELAERSLGDKINCLVNNAGISLHEGNFMKVTPESFDNQFNTNLKGGYFLTQQFLKYVDDNNITKANVIFITSEKGIFVDNMPYGLTKCALNSLTQALANEYIRKGIRINAIAPGVTTSDMTGYKPEGNLYAYFQMNRRLYLPEEVAEIASFILSDAAHCLSGQIIAVNEGKTVNRPLEIRCFD